MTKVMLEAIEKNKKNAEPIPIFKVYSYLLKL